MDPVTPRFFPGRGRVGNQVLTPWRPASQLSGENSCVASLQRGKTSVLWEALQPCDRKQELQIASPASRFCVGYNPRWLCSPGPVTSPASLSLTYVTL